MTQQQNIEMQEASHDGEREIPITELQIQDFLAYQQAQGYAATSIENYGRSLRMFYTTLPPDKLVSKKVVRSWYDGLIEHGYAPRTINCHVSAVNSFFAYLDKRELQIPQHIDIDEQDQPELTREEYQRLLITARRKDKIRLYLLIKVLVVTGVTLQNLPSVTVEALYDGHILGEKGQRDIFFPDFLQKELLQYAENNGIEAGGIFVTRNRKPISRVAVSGMIRRLCEDAGIEPSKGNPRCLKRLYNATKEKIEEKVRIIAEAEYRRLLEEEDQQAGWGIADA